MLNLYDFIEKCCQNKKLEINPQTIIDNLLSYQDEQDIINGELSIENVDWIIQLWARSGMYKKNDKPESDRKKTLVLMREYLCVT